MKDIGTYFIEWPLSECYIIISYYWNIIIVELTCKWHFNFAPWGLICKVTIAGT